jgi:hypothetical protein
MCLFIHAGYEEVMRLLVGGWRGPDAGRVSWQVSDKSSTILSVWAFWLASGAVGEENAGSQHHAQVLAGQRRSTS